MVEHDIHKQHGSLFLEGRQYLAQFGVFFLTAASEQVIGKVYVTLETVIGVGSPRFLDRGQVKGVVPEFPLLPEEGQPLLGWSDAPGKDCLLAEGPQVHFALTEENGVAAA